MLRHGWHNPRPWLALFSGVMLNVSVAQAHGDGDDDNQPTPVVLIGGVTGGISQGSGSVVPLSSVPQLSSRPQASAKIYLDFVGDTTNTWSTYSPGTTPAYDQDGDTTTFSTGELNNINSIWARVAEKYSPFNIDVTTIDPGAARFTSKDSLKVVVGGAGAWLGETAGGVSYVSEYSDNGSNTSNKVFVFSSNLGGGDAKITAEAAAHEPGHAFGLKHQSVYTLNAQGYYTKQAEYNPGTSAGPGANVVPGSKAPVMGYSYTADRGIWWSGSYSQGIMVVPAGRSPLQQNDLAVISSLFNNGFGYRADDHGNTIAAADPMTIIGSTLSASGVIENTGDIDMFSFNVPQDAYVSLSILSARFGTDVIGMLDAKAELFSSSGQLLGTSSVIDSISTPTPDESFAMFLPAGSYDLAVESQGSYGDVGQYTVSGTIAIPEPFGIAFAAGAMLLLIRPRRKPVSG